MVAPRLLFLGHSRLQRALLVALARELVVGALVTGQFAVFQMQDRAHRAVHKAAVVADDDDGVRVLCKVGLQPERAF